MPTRTAEMPTLAEAALVAVVAKGVVVFSVTAAVEGMLPVAVGEEAFRPEAATSPRLLKNIVDVPTRRSSNR